VEEDVDLRVLVSHRGRVRRQDDANLIRWNGRPFVGRDEGDSVLPGGHGLVAALAERQSGDGGEGESRHCEFGTFHGHGHSFLRSGRPRAGPAPFFARKVPGARKVPARFLLLERRESNHVRASPLPRERRAVTNEHPPRLRIAQVAPLYESVPPKLYGGT